MRGSDLVKGRGVGVVHGAKVGVGLVGEFARRWLSSFQSSLSTSNSTPFWWNGNGSGSRSSLQIWIGFYLLVNTFSDFQTAVSQIRNMFSLFSAFQILNNHLYYAWISISTFSPQNSPTFPVFLSFSPPFFPSVYNLNNLQQNVIFSYIINFSTSNLFTWLTTWTKPPHPPQKKMRWNFPLFTGCSHFSLYWPNLRVKRMDHSKQESALCRYSFVRWVISSIWSTVCQIIFFGHS